MKDPEWRPMSSLLLLLAWEQCKNMQSAKKLLDTLYHPQVDSCALNPGFNLFAYLSSRIMHGICLLI